MINQIKKIIPLVAFIAYGVKVFISSPSYPEVLILGILAGAYIFLERDNRSSKHSELEEKFNKLQSNIDEKTKDIEIMKTSMTSMKLATGMRSLGNK